MLFQEQSYRLEYAEESLAAATAAKPVTISVRNSFGRQTVRYDSAALDNAYETLGGLLGEALETATQLESVSKAGWNRALQSSSIYYVYSDALPVSLLSSWLEVSCQLDQQTDQLLISLQEDCIYLYCAGSDGYLCATTAVDAARFAELTEACRPDGSAFVLELQNADYRNLNPQSLLSLSSTTSVAKVEAANPVDSARIANLASLFNFNPYGNSYTTHDGTQIYDESTRSLSIGTDGLLTVRNSSTQNELFQAEADSDEALVEYARALLERVGGETRGDARLQLTGLQRTDNGVELSFDYFISGIRVRTAYPSAARLLFNGTRLSEMRLLLRSYTLTGERQNLLPERQAAAIVKRGSCLQIFYLDQGVGLLAAGWSRE